MRYLAILFILITHGLHAQLPQIAIPRIERMPSQPAPYNLRDWKTVALQYDSFVYDPSKSGQHLPLVSIHPQGYNYPDYPTFGLHTYVGTVNPNGNEAINVLPSLVGATLCGIDKQNQFGRNWLKMAQDFFSKKTNIGIYLNNANGGSGSDWWYDVMPNVYFYQLYNLYPTEPEAEIQFRSIAEKFLASVRVLGGSDTPWQKANFDYRAFNFQTMQPNPNGLRGGRRLSRRPRDPRGGDDPRGAGPAGPDAGSRPHSSQPPHGPRCPPARDARGEDRPRPRRPGVGGPRRGEHREPSYHRGVHACRQRGGGQRPRRGRGGLSATDPPPARPAEAPAAHGIRV